MDITLAEFEEVLDNKLSKMATKEDLKSFATKEDLKSFEQRIDEKFEKQSKELKEYAEDQTETLAAYIAETIAIPLQEHIESCQKIRI